MRTLFFFLIISAAFLAACSSSKENSNIDQQKYVSEKIPPGTAIVEAKIQSIEENTSAQTLNVKILKVFGYGQSTKPIADKTEMKIELPKSLLTNQTSKDFVQVGGVYQLEISQPSKTMNAETNSDWQANTIKKIR